MNNNNNTFYNMLSKTYKSTLKNTPKYKREMYKDISKTFESTNVLLVGLRQVGKTILSEQLLNEYIAKRDELHIKQSKSLVIDAVGIPKDEVAFYINLKNINNLVYEDLFFYLSSKDYEIVFIDEIQVLKNWTGFIQTIIDLKKNTKFIFSGSQASELNKENMTGRIKTHYVFPLSYVEYKHIWANDSIDTYFKFGSYPINKEGVPAAVQYMNMIDEQIIDKISVHDGDKPLNTIKFKSVAKSFVNRLGREVKFNTLDTDLKVSLPTIKEYFNLMNSSLLVRKLWKYNDLSTKRVGKVYYTDKSMIYWFNNFMELEPNQMGYFIENLVFNYLDSYLHNKYGFNKIFYYRNGIKEIDFVIPDKEIFIEVKYRAHLDVDKFIEKYDKLISDNLKHYKKVCVTKDLDYEVNNWRFISVKTLLEKGSAYVFL